MQSPSKRAVSRRTLTCATLVLATVGLCGTAPAPAAQNPPSWTPYDRPAQYGIVTEQNVPITMSDGVQLNAIVYRPDAPGTFPVIVTLTPYNGGMSIVGSENEYLVQRGYVQVVVDVRGTGSSAGTGTTLAPASSSTVPRSSSGRRGSRGATATSACGAPRTWRSRSS